MKTTSAAIVSDDEEEKEPTTDHALIQRWITENKGKPALIQNVNGNAQKVGLRIDFPGKEDEDLLSSAWQSNTVSWDEFFSLFEQQKLALVIDEHESDKTMAYRFIYREALADE